MLYLSCPNLLICNRRHTNTFLLRFKPLILESKLHWAFHALPWTTPGHQFTPYILILCEHLRFAESLKSPVAIKTTFKLDQVRPKASTRTTIFVTFTPMHRRTIFTMFLTLFLVFVWLYFESFRGPFAPICLIIFFNLYIRCKLIAGLPFFGPTRPGGGYSYSRAAQTEDNNNWGKEKLKVWTNARVASSSSSIYT